MTAVDELIASGEAESQFFECKAPTSGRFDEGLKTHLGKAISALSNAGGGVLLYGVETERHQQTGLDILKQVTYVPQATTFRRQLELYAALLTEPRIQIEAKILKRNTSDTKGVVVVNIPPTIGDPVRVKGDHYYLRVGDSSEKMPTETIKRMYQGTTSPNLNAKFSSEIIELQDDGYWRIPIVLSNSSTRLGKSIITAVRLENGNSVDSVTTDVFRDMSSLNPNSKVFIAENTTPVYRGLDHVAGVLRVRMHGTGRNTSRILLITIEIYAEDMRAKYVKYRLTLTRSLGFSSTLLGQGNVY